MTFSVNLKMNIRWLSALLMCRWGHRVLVYRQIWQLNPVACPVNMLCRAPITCPRVVYPFQAGECAKDIFFSQPILAKRWKKNIQWHFSNSSAKLNHANWSQREQWQLLIPMLPVYPFQFLMRSTSRSPKKSVPNHDPTLGINIKNHDQLLYFFGGGCIQSSQGKYGNNILSKPVQTIQVLPESRPIQLHAAKKTFTFLHRRVDPAATSGRSTGRCLLGTQETPAICVPCVFIVPWCSESSFDKCSQISSRIPPFLQVHFSFFKNMLQPVQGWQWTFG